LYPTTLTKRHQNSYDFKQYLHHIYFVYGSDNCIIITWSRTLTCEGCWQYSLRSIGNSGVGYKLTKYKLDVAPPKQPKKITIEWRKCFEYFCIYSSVCYWISRTRCTLTRFDKFATAAPCHLLTHFTLITDTSTRASTNNVCTLCLHCCNA
jgi:hypothetical protein